MSNEFDGAGKKPNVGNLQGFGVIDIDRCVDEIIEHEEPDRRISSVNDDAPTEVRGFELARGRTTPADPERKDGDQQHGDRGRPASLPIRGRPPTPS